MLKITRCLVGETAVIHRGRPLSVELHPAFVVVRFMRTRDRYAADWNTLYRPAQRADTEPVIAVRHAQHGRRRI
jgi:hypothetical protein